VTLSKSAPATVQAGDNLAYTLSLGNSGTQPSGTTLIVKDLLPTGVSYVGETAGTNVSSVTCSAASQLLTCTVTLSSPLAASGAKTATGADFTINTTAPNTTGALTNYATANPDGTSTLPTDPSSSCTPSATTVCASAPTTVQAPTVAKTFGAATISNGGSTTLIFTLTNSSGDPAQSGITLGDTLPTNLLLNSATPAVSYSTGCTGPATATYASSVLSGLTGLAMTSGTSSCTVTVAGLTHVSGQTNASCSSNPAAFTNLASNVTITGATNASTDQCLVVQTATAVTLSKTGAATALVSGSVDYSLTLTNTGTAATGTTLHVLDQLPIGVTATAVMGLTNMAAGGVSCTNLNVAGGLLDCTVTLTTPMAAGTGTTSASFKVTTTMPSAVPSPALLTNYASTDPTGGSTPTAPGSSCSGSECGSQGTTVTATAPTITKSFTPPNDCPGRHQHPDDHPSQQQCRRGDADGRSD
jgi:uncharacterized repeat protein (TIGR01451 family)